MKTEEVCTLLCGHAMEALESISIAYDLPPCVLLRVILESVLDAASEDGQMQAELAAGARYLREKGHVPDCWLELEGERFEDGGDDSGTSFDPDEDPDGKFREYYEADYGDVAAVGGREQSDASIFCDLRRAASTWHGPVKPKPPLSSLADAG